MSIARNCSEIAILWCCSAGAGTAGAGSAGGPGAGAGAAAGAAAEVVRSSTGVVLCSTE